MQLFLLYVQDLAVACAHAGPVRGRRGLPTWSRPRSGPAEGRPAPSLLPWATNAPTPRRLWASGQFFLTPTKTWPLCCRTLCPSSDFLTFDQTKSAGGKSKKKKKRKAKKQRRRKQSEAQRQKLVPGLVESSPCAALMVCQQRVVRQDLALKLF